MRKGLLSTLSEPVAERPQIDRLSHKTLYWPHTASVFSKRNDYEPKYDHHKTYNTTEVNLFHMILTYQATSKHKILFLLQINLTI